jgi:hypothetical protein
MTDKNEKRAVDTFVNVIRAKPHWHFEILQQKELVIKWIEEAHLEEGSDLDVMFRYVWTLVYMRAPCSYLS